MNPSGPSASDRPHEPRSHAGVTRNEYDALADLFLGDAAFAPPTAHAVHAAAPILHTSPAAPHTVSQPVHQSLHLAGQPAIYPEQMSSHVQTSGLHHASHSPQGATPNVWRLVGEPVTLPASQPSTAAAEVRPMNTALPESAVTIEAIVQGHLPIFASAWVPQYARSIATDTGAPVALIRVRHGQISVERFASELRPSTPLPKYATLAEAVESVDAPRILLQVDELAEPDLWHTPGLDRVTVLTGADEAAMVACYRTLKTIAQELAHDLSPDHVEDVAQPAIPALAVAVLGATPERATQTITRMQRAASNFLSRQIQGHHAAGRIGSGQSETLFRGIALEGDSSPVALIALLRAALHHPHHQCDASQQASESVTSPTSAAGHLHLTEPATAAPPAAPVNADRISRVSAWDRVAARLEDKLGPRASSASFPAEPSINPAIPHIEVKPAPNTPNTSNLRTLESTTAADVTSFPATASVPERSESGHPPLATFVDELLAIQEQCPYAETVEFAISADGRLHLLAHTCNQTHTGHPGGQGRALEELTTAAAWAMAHAKLVARSHAGLKLDEVEHRPILHLITDRPRESKRLLESDIRVHLVAPVDPDARFVCRDLN